MIKDEFILLISEIFHILMWIVLVFSIYLTITYTHMYMSVRSVANAQLSIAKRNIDAGQTSWSTITERNTHLGMPVEDPKIKWDLYFRKNIGANRDSKTNEDFLRLCPAGETNNPFNKQVFSNKNCVSEIPELKYGESYEIRLVGKSLYSKWFFDSIYTKSLEFVIMKTGVNVGNFGDGYQYSWNTKKTEDTNDSYNSVNDGWSRDENEIYDKGDLALNMEGLVN